MKITDTDVVGPDEALSDYGLTRQHLYDLRRRGRIKGIRIGRMWVYPRSELVNYLKTREKKFASRPLPDPK